MSEVAVPEYVMPEADAERLTRRITLMAGTLREGMEKLHGLVAEAKSGNAHVALGYPSWTAYLAATLGKEPLRLERGARQELVGYLAGEGMSTRAIAPIVAVDQKTVVRDLARGEANASPGEPEDIPEPEFMARTANATEEQFEDALAAARADDDLSRASVASHLGDVPRADLPPFDPATGEVLDTPALSDDPNRIVKLTGPGSVSSPREVTGMDGKTYTRPATRKPKRSEAETYLNLVASYADRAAREAANLTPAQIERVKPNAAHWVDGIGESVEALQRLLASLTGEK